MFEISDLKAKKLPELQEIAKDLKVPKFKSLKKLDLVYQILDLQASNPVAVTKKAPQPEQNTAPKPKRTRARITKDKPDQTESNKAQQGHHKSHRHNQRSYGNHHAAG